MTESEEEPIEVPFDDDLEEFEQRELEEAIKASKVETGPTIEEISSEEESELQMNRRLRNQQDIDYERSLKQDQEKERQRRFEEERKRMEEEMRIEQEEENQAVHFSLQLTREKRMKDLQDSLGSEPDAKFLNTTQIAVRMPNGQRLQRRFLASSKLRMLKDFVELKSMEMNLPSDFQIASDFPRKTYKNWNITFQEADLYPRAAVTVSNP